MIKTLQKPGIEGTYLSIVKAIYDKPIANFILSGGKLIAFTLRSGTRQTYSLSWLLFNIVVEVLATAIREEKNKRNPDWKRRSTVLTVCRWHDTVYKNPKYSIRKLLECISEFRILSGYKINTQKSLTFPYPNNEKSERKIKESIPFTISEK